MTKDNELVEQLVRDFTLADLNRQDRAMLDYSAKLTHAPHAMIEQDVVGLRAVGFDDRAILDIAQIVAYYAYVNRIADGLGVALEYYWEGNE